MSSIAATISVQWGNDVAVSITLPPRTWAALKAGKFHSIRGKGYYYEGDFFWDYWDFGGGLNGTLRVQYGKNNTKYLGVGFDGTLDEATIEEHLAKVQTRSKKKR